ncbi:PREDICTED: ankyrin-3-like isoform X1 [Populus euphratica]|uniref:Ankyrin-3-like isoform X1 n=2 Tax=Populus euphratica TaxID=75702 RepID=A0AAJ6V432_POPEU|nr:PREDICTED: ankyrin-3-like isoform X1 [Populus euphratica]XP_011040608.1 PREDICTED: ankyrin-3-like isoform X1 [Populus euphratica]
MARYSYVYGSERDELAEPSQRLIEAALSGDVEFVTESLKSKTVDVNYIGTVNLRVKCIETVLREEEADEIEIQYRDFVTDVTPLFAAAHSGHVEIARKLLSAGADVNQELFRGFATTAAAREGHCVLLDMLLKAGASHLACEDALLEACLCGQSKAAELLICSEMTGPDVAQHALVSASCRGFVDVVTTLIKNGVDINCTRRVLLQSVKPALHANVDCTPLVAAIVSRQVSVVKYLLEAGARSNCYVRLGAWSWDIFSGEELRVGACLGEPYNEVWCAVEYYEASGQILNLLLQHQISFLESQQQGRNLLCHAILCHNSDAMDVLLNAGADVEFCLRTKKGHEFRPIHLAARMGCLRILKQVIFYGCEVDSRTETGDTALMLAAKSDQADCFLELIVSGADLGLVNNNGESAVHLVKRSVFGSSLADIFRQAITTGRKVRSSNLEVFSLLHFVAGIGNTELLQMILQHSTEDISKHDGLGLTPAMVAVKAGHTEVFRLLINAGADISKRSRDGQAVVSLLQNHACSSVRTRFEEILLDAVLSHKVTSYSEFRALHFAAHVGNLPAIVQLLEMGIPINSVDDSGHSPLMLAAREGHADACKILLQRGADCGIINQRGEAAISLARKSTKCKAAERVIFDYLAHSHVLHGEELWKHTREGKGSPHMKVVQMLKSGLLTWGKSNRRNVVCKEAVAGPSPTFLKNRRKVNEAGDEMVFRVLTETGREIHFEASSSSSLELWVHGINLITKEATTGVW